MVAGTARAGVDFIVILVERREHYHLDEINKKISIFSYEKIVREHPIFLGGKIYLRPLREDRRCREERRCLVFLAALDDLRPLL